MRVCGRADIADGEAKRFEIDGRAIAVVRIGEEYRAIDDTCSHADYSLSEGEIEVDDCAIECWKHGSLFSLETGEALTLPAIKPVAVHAVRLDGDDVIVEVAAP